jgi:hypothetical protein
MVGLQVDQHLIFLNSVALYPVDDALRVTDFSDAENRAAHDGFLTAFILLVPLRRDKLERNAWDVSACGHKR